MGGQFRRHLPAYLKGAAVLGLFQLAMNRIDWLPKAAIDRLFGDAEGQAWCPATGIFPLTVVALVARGTRRLFFFKAGGGNGFE